MNLTELVIKKIEELGDKAPEFFGKTASALKTMAKTKNIPLKIAQKVLDDLPKTDAPVQNAVDLLQKHDKALSDVIGYLNQKVIPVIETDVAARLKSLEDKIANLLAAPQQTGNGGQTVGQLLAEGSRVRPNAHTIATYSEPVGGGQTTQVTGHPLDTGIAPTQEQVAASQNIAQGAIPGQTGRLAGPAVAVPGSEKFGRMGWTDPYPHKG